MKAEELINYIMIGDWFKCTDPTPMQITVIDSWDMVVKDQEDLRVEIGDLQPIPLTEEILLKNGFSDYAMRNSVNTGYLWQSHNSAIYVNPEKFRFMFRWENNGESVCKRFRYVHELQHLLRVCGLRYLADNFIV